MSSIGNFYFNASDGGPTDSSNSWNNDANACDGNVNTVATATGVGIGEGSANTLRIDGTNAAGGGVIISARVRIHNGSNWGDYVSIDTPQHGWSWDMLASLESFSLYSPFDSMQTYLYKNGDYEGDILAVAEVESNTLSKIEIEVTYDITPVVGSKYPLPAFKNIT